MHKSDVQKWLDIIRGAHLPTQLDAMRMGTRPPFPYSDTRLLPYLQHSFWFLPTVAACQAMANLLAESGNKVSVKAYSGYRHEIHNELELRDEVEAGLVGFVNGVLG